MLTHGAQLGQVVDVVIEQRHLGDAHPGGALALSERRELGRLGARAPGVPITEVPLLDHDVDNLAELRVVGEHLSAV